MPATPDVLTIAGTTIDLVATNTNLDRLVTFARGGMPSLDFNRLMHTPGALPDPWHLKTCTLTMRGTPVFSGYVTGYIDRYLSDLGWVREYRALGLAWAGNYVPVTDAQTFSDTSTWNLPGDDPAQIASRAGQSVGAVVTNILTMQTNANALNAFGIGAYTSLSPPTLPSLTTTDLAALSVIPPTVVRVAGERILSALESFVQQYHPNHYMHVQADGTIRFLDPRQATNYVITLNDPNDPRWDLPDLTRDATDNYSRVVVRGNTLVQAITLQDQPWAGSTLPDGGLQEDFAHDGLTSAAAKAAWHPSMWSQPNAHGAPADVGTCTCPDTLHVTINTVNTYSLNQLAQGAGQLLGWLTLSSDSLGGLAQQFWQARIVSNTPTSAGSCTCQVDVPLPALTYNSYQLFTLAGGANVVGRRYKITNSAYAHALQLAFPYPVPYVYNSGTAAEMISSPMATLFFNATGTAPPYISTTVGITIDPVGGRIYLDEPAPVAVAGLLDPPRWPAVVQALLAVGVGAYQAVAPASGYAGTLYTIEGVQRTKTITVLEWRDSSNQTSMNLYASEMLDAVKDVVVEGSLPYLGLPDLGYLTPGRSVSIQGPPSGSCHFVTGWESIALPVVSAEVAFQPGPGGTSYVTALQLSNRRQAYDASNFLKPNVTGIMIAGRLGGAFGTTVAASVAESSKYRESSEMATRQMQALSEYRGTGKLPDFTRLGFRPEDVADPRFDPRQAMGMVGETLGAIPGGGPSARGVPAVGPGTTMAAMGASAGAMAGGFGSSVAMAGAGMGGPQRLYSPQEQARAQQQAREDLEEADKERQRVQADRQRQRQEEEELRLRMRGPR